MQNEKLVDFSYYKRIYNTIKDWFDWNIVFFRMKKGEFELENTIILANRLTARYNKKYYVIPNNKGKLIAINSNQFKAYRAKGYFRKSLHAYDLQKDCLYQTYPHGTKPID